MNDFNSVQELDVKQVKNDIDFPISRIDLVKENPYSTTRYQMVHRDDVDKDLGIVKENHPIIPYPEVMSWLTSEFDNVNLQYKLKDSVIKKNGDLFQEYLFDYDIPSPDGSDISPLVIVKSSYTGSPLDIYFGTYRFVCSNGVMTGETIEKIHVGSRNFDVLQSSIQADIKASLKKFDQVAGLYKQLQNEDFNPYLDTIILDQYLSTKCKKIVLEELQNLGSIQVLKDKIKAQDFNDDFRENLIKTVNDITAWEFYNIVTNVVTRKSRSVASRLSNFRSISKSFGI